MSDKRYGGDYPTMKASLPRDAQFEAPKVMLARDIMTKRLITVGPEAMVMDVVVMGCIVVQTKGRRGGSGCTSMVKWGDPVAALWL